MLLPYMSNTRTHRIHNPWLRICAYYPKHIHNSLAIRTSKPLNLMPLLLATRLTTVTMKRMRMMMMMMKKKKKQQQKRIQMVLMTTMRMSLSTIACSLRILPKLCILVLRGSRTNYTQKAPSLRKKGKSCCN